MKILKKLWKLLDGNKTIICSVGLAALEAGLIPLTGGWYAFVKTILIVGGGASLLHHVKKGYFTTKDIDIKKK